MSNIDKTLHNLELEIIQSSIALAGLPESLDFAMSIRDLENAPETSTTRLVANGAMDVLSASLGFDDKTALIGYECLSGESIASAAKDIVVKIFRGIALAGEKALELILRFVRWVAGLFGKSSGEIAATAKEIKSLTEKVTADMASTKLSAGDKLTVEKAKDLASSGISILVSDDLIILDPSILNKDIATAFPKRVIPWANAKKETRYSSFRNSFRLTAMPGAPAAFIQNLTTGVDRIESMMSQNPWSTLDGLTDALEDLKGKKIEDGIKDAAKIFTDFEMKFLTKENFMVKGKTYVSQALPGLKEMTVIRKHLFEGVDEKDNIVFLKASIKEGKFTDTKNLPTKYAELTLGLDIIKEIEEINARAHTIVIKAEERLSAMEKFIKKFGNSGTFAVQIFEGIEELKGDVAPEIIDQAHALLKRSPNIVFSYNSIIKDLVGLLNNYQGASGNYCDEIKHLTTDLLTTPKRFA